MGDIREFRIGNFLDYKGEIHYVSLLSLDIDDEYEEQIGIVKLGQTTDEISKWNRAFGNDLKPIPLTEEWLFRFGFIHDGGDGYKSPIGEHFYFSLRNDLIHKMYRGTKFVGVKYVHQLQNLYFTLTGEELTIKNN